jgi:hypothetical protein
MTFVGSDFAINGVSVPCCYAQYFASDYASGTLTGTLANGDPLNNYFEIHDRASIILELAPSMAETIYVDADANGAGDGTSWEDAYKHLQDALANANSGDTILVAKGTYYPDTNSADPNGSNDREATFQLIDDVTIEGGYTGNSETSTCCIKVDPNQKQMNLDCCCKREPDPNADGCGCCNPRKCTGQTILSGEINDVNITADNSYHVVTGSGTDSNAVLLNVTISGGNADGSFPNNNGGGIYNDNGSPTIKYCCIIDNNAVDAGGGMYNYRQSNPTLTSNSFCGNSAIWGAGLANFAFSSPVLHNCVFRDNIASETGGGINNTVLSDPEIVNCTFYSNTAGFFGGGIYANGSDPDVYNSILWANSAPNGPQIALVANNRRTHIGYCDLQGDKAKVYRDNATVVWNGPIMNRDPNFVAPDKCNLRLRTISPCLDASHNGLIGSGIDKDRDRNLRRIEIPAAAPPPGFGVSPTNGPIADLGAYERPFVIYVWGEGCDDDPNDPNGTSWVNAYVFLQDALLAAQPGDQIWVAECNYTPDRFTDFPNLRFHPEQTFNLKNEVTLLGGFDGTETDIADRDCNPKAHETILSGDLFGNDSGAPFNSTYFENSWNVVTADSNVDATAVVDGFTIKGGYANGTSPLTPWNKGGGMHNLGSPRIRCCSFETNWAYDQGGAMYNEGSPKLIDCRFEGNFTRQQGAGLCNIGGSPKLVCCSFVRNEGPKEGAGMYNEDANATLVDCTFTENGSTHEDGGGMASVRTKLLLCDCNFAGNTADQDGGAMYNQDCDQMKLYQCRFKTNTAQDDGGAIFNENCDYMLLVNCAFLKNEAIAGWGGGLHNVFCNRPRLVNCTFTENESQEGGAIYNGYGAGLMKIDNCILWKDTAPYGPEISLEECDLDINYSILQGGEPNIFVWGNVSIHGEDYLLTDDPMMDSEGYITSPNSPAIDAGDNAALPICVTTDLSGGPRRVGTVDIGAYEFHNPGPYCFPSTDPQYSLWLSLDRPESWCYDCFDCGDADGDCQLTFADIDILSNAWPPNTYDPRADLTKDGTITFADINVLITHWPLKGGPGCQCPGCQPCTPVP